MREGDKVLDEKRQGEALLLDENQMSSKKLYIESYGCAMNFSDSEIVASILTKEGYSTTRNIDDADLVFLNTCSIREKAEQTVRNRLVHIKGKKKTNPGMLVGVLGCMAERLKSKLLEEEQLVDIVVGPDAYRDLPNLITQAGGGQKAVNVLLSREETYADLSPVRLGDNGVSAFVSIMRGCDNMCTFCVVPFTRGRERSRDPHTIVKEAQELANNGFKEVTLLGQNVDSYRWSDNEELKGNALKEAPREEVIDFAKLLEMVAQVSPDLRIRFSTSHPKDITDDVLYAMRDNENVANYIHFPAQSGNTRILKKMNRTYTREWYDTKLNRIREIIPNCGITTDIITGFCSETEEEHQETVDLMVKSKFDMAYMYFYSERPGTLAARKYEDDIPEEVKKRRLQEIIDVQMESRHESHQKDVGKTFKVLVEGISKKSGDQLVGRNDQNKAIIFDKKDKNPGDYVMVKVTDCTRATLIGELV